MNLQDSFLKIGFPFTNDRWRECRENKFGGLDSFFGGSYNWPRLFSRILLDWSFLFFDKIVHRESTKIYLCYIVSFVNKKNPIIVMARELKLHSPAGSDRDPDVYQWTEDREAVSIVSFPHCLQ